MNGIPVAEPDPTDDQVRTVPAPPPDPFVLPETVADSLGDTQPLVTIQLNQPELSSPPEES